MEAVPRTSISATTEYSTDQIPDLEHTGHIAALFNVHNINSVENVHSRGHASGGISAVHKETVNIGGEISSVAREVSFLGVWQRNRRLHVGHSEFLKSIRKNPACRKGSTRSPSGVLQPSLLTEWATAKIAIAMSRLMYFIAQEQ